MSGFKWDTNLSVEEGWLNSDREILARMAEGVSEDGHYMMSVDVPNGETYSFAFEQKNYAAATAFCNAVREQYNEWKTSKEAASRRAFRDREQQAVLGADGREPGGDGRAEEFPVAETVSALEEGVQGGASLKETLVQRLDSAVSARGKLHQQFDQLKKQIEAYDIEVNQLETMLEVIRASEVLGEASESVRGDAPVSAEDVGGPAHSPETDRESDREPEQGSTEAETDVS